jgi:HlyD family secretion protein
MRPAVKHWKRWLLALVLLAAAAATAGLFLDGGRPVRVRVHRPETGRVEEIVTSNSVGTVEPEKTAGVAAEISGKILRIPVRQGPVTAGQAVVELDTKDLDAEREVTVREIATSRARLAQAAVQKRKVSEDLERYRKVDVPKGDVERLERDLEIAAKAEEILSQSILTLEAQLGVIELRTRKAKVAAPFDGIVVKLHGEEGESVVPGKLLFTLHSAGPLLVRAPLDEVDMGRLSLGLPVRVTFDAYRGEKFAGEICEITPAASADQNNNRTVDIKIRVPKMPGNVKAGMSANIEVVIRWHDPVLRIPTHLVRDDREGRGKFVFVAENGRAVRRAVTAGYSNWEVTEISEGLGPSDAVIVPLRDESEGTVKDGARVSVVPDGR